MKRLLFAIVFLTLFACTRQSPKPVATDTGDCENAVTINEQRYNETSPFVFTITKAEINGDCLEITINASGCSGTTWKAELVTNGAVAESNPPQMYLKVLFINKEACLAVPSRKFSYNLKPLKVDGMNKVTLHLQDWSQALVWEY